MKPFIEHQLLDRIIRPAGIIGFPTFLISLLISLAQEKKRREKEEPYG